MRSYQWVCGLLALSGLSLLMSTGAAAEESFHECNIEYEIRHLEQPGKNTDTGPFTKQFIACVRDLSDCTRRDMALARARESLYVPAGEGEEPDLNSIRIVSHSLEGRCSKLD